MNIKIDKDNILYYTNLLEDPEEFVSSIESLNDICLDESPISKWKEWTASNSDTVYGSVKSSSFSNMNARDINDSKEILISLKIKGIVERCAKDYKEKTGIDPDFLPDYYTINKYLPGVYMGPHVDYEGEGRTTLIPSVSMVFYLNDNYDGGTVEFPKQGVSIKPEAGSLIIFPSNKPYYHDPKPVTSGTKYMIPLFWFNNKV
jgi:hypothetical protein